jgi:hypothetical protein
MSAISSEKHMLETLPLLPEANATQPAASDVKEPARSRRPLYLTGFCTALFLVVATIFFILVAIRQKECNQSGSSLSKRDQGRDDDWWREEQGQDPSCFDITALAWTCFVLYLIGFICCCAACCLTCGYACT